MADNQRNIIYPTLTRPDLMFGAVPRAYLPVSIVISALLGILFQNILIGLLFWPVVMFGGYVGGKIDPDFMEIWKVKTQTIKRTKGKTKGNYYHA